VNTKETFSFKLNVEVEISGKRPSDEIIKEKIIEAMNESFPSFICDDDELDVQIFTETFEFSRN